MRYLEFALVCAGVGLSGGILVKNADELGLNVNKVSLVTTPVPSVSSTASFAATQHPIDITTDVTSAADLSVPASRKEDYVGAASHGYGSFAPYPGDFKYGGGYGGGVGYGYGGYDPLRGLLVPLAGVALLGAAAMFVSNPVLLQLGVIGGKRRRRDALEDPMVSYDKLKEIRALETFIEQLPQDQVQKQEKKLVANYLKCSSSIGGSKCLERLACEIQKPSSNSTALERQVLDIVTGEMMKNEFISKDLKLRIKKAEELGSAGGKCERYFCAEVDT